MESHTDRFPFDLFKAANGTVDTTNRFVLHRDYEALNRLRQSRGNSSLTFVDLANSAMARFALIDEDLYGICEGVWGLEGPDTEVLHESIKFPGSELKTYDATKPGKELLDVRKYNRIFKQGLLDASGLQNASRGFNDPMLFVARTRRANVVHGASYMIPLELVTRSPLEHWNPFGVPLQVAMPPAPPYQAAYTHGAYYMVPSGFSGTSTTVPANTTQASVQVAGKPVEASGIFILRHGLAEFKNDQDQTISTSARQRFPIYPSWHDYTYGNVQLQHFVQEVKTVLKANNINMM